MPRAEGAELPTDENSLPIQALSPGTVVNDDIDGTTDRLAIPAAAASGTGIVEVAVTADAYIAFGGSSVTASTTVSMFYPKGAAVYKVPANATHIAYIQASSAGRITCTHLT